MSRPCQRDRLLASAGDLRVITQAVTSVSQELSTVMDDVSAADSVCVGILIR